MMKPETLARRKAARVLNIAARRQSLLQRLEANVKRDGPDSIWPELLAELRSDLAKLDSCQR